MDGLRAIGMEAELAMLEETGGANTHRGAIFGLGLLCAAAGAASSGAAQAQPFWNACMLGATVRRRWGAAIMRGPIPCAAMERMRCAASAPAVRERRLPRLSRRARRRAAGVAAWPRAGTWRSGGRSHSELLRPSGISRGYQPASSRRCRRPALRPGEGHRISWTGRRRADAVARASRGGASSLHRPPPQPGRLRRPVGDHALPRRLDTRA